MENRKKIGFPKGFFTKKRPTTTNKEVLKDVIPINWTEEVKEKGKIVCSKKQKTLWKALD